MIRGMEIGLHNSRGATWRGPGGGQERNLASKYRAFSRQLQVDYPITSRMLEQVAQSSDGQAEWHATDAAVRKRRRRRYGWPLSNEARSIKGRAMHCDSGVASIGRAWCRQRGSQDGSTSVVG